MTRIMIGVTLILLFIGCAGYPIPPSSGVSGKEQTGHTENPPSSPLPLLPASTPALEKTSTGPQQGELTKLDRNLSPVAETSLEKTVIPPKIEEPKAEASPPLLEKRPLMKITTIPKKDELQKPSPKKNPSKPPIHEGRKENREEAEQDIMEEALGLLNESHSYWVNGNIEDALEMLDQAYALLLDTNGNPDIARQKDDLRLIISKKILAIYNSIPKVAKGKRSEIPVIVNADVEKEIRLFQTKEREFFISSYKRSAIYRPLIVRELEKAGLPEELSWLPLVESGFKINALSSARALGLWQFIPSTGYKYGLNRDDWIDERMDIEKSTRAAIDYLKELHTMFGDWLTVLAAYNCGEGRVIRTIASQHINYLDRFWDLYQKLPYETARYVPRFLATLLVIRDPQKYGIELGEGTAKVSALSYEVVEINKSMRLQNIARKLGTSEETMNILNAELRRGITPDRAYKLKVPFAMAGELVKVIDEVPQAVTPRESFRTKRRAVIRHKVRPGETLSSIASKYRTTVGAITAHNHLSKKHRLLAGQRLDVPIRTVGGADSSPSSPSSKPKGPLRYRVQKGDTLISLAKKYDTTVADLKSVNRLENDRLKIGQILRIAGDDNEGEKGQKGHSEKEVAVVGKTGMKATPVQKNEMTKVKKYTVKKGDSLNKIARENNISLERLLDLNRPASKDSIYPGQVIKIQ
jgi:membrane-bound lytic murein transglycosylase D